MGILSSIFLIIIAVILLWSLYLGIKNNPQAFSAQNLNKSFFTMGILAIILIVIIGFVIVMLAK